MLPATRELIDEAAAHTGRPIHVLMDAELEVSASIQIARHGAAQHMLRVRPSEAADYFIANQVLFMLRLLELPVADRFDFSPALAADAAMAETLRGCLGPGGPEIRNDDPLVQNFTRWALMQLRSIPIGMRVDQQIFRDMPSLRASLQAGFKEQNQSNFAAIQRLEHLASLPRRYLWPAAAYALFTDRLTGESLHAVPFEAMGLGQGGRDLLRLYDGTPSDAEHDRNLVDAWAVRLGLNGWYRWIPYQP
jgi:hypothetical protein